MLRGREYLGSQDKKQTGEACMHVVDIAEPESIGLVRLHGYLDSAGNRVQQRCCSTYVLILLLVMATDSPTASPLEMVWEGTMTWRSLNDNSE